MKMPGFTADSSLYQPTQAYRTAGALGQVSDTVQPASLATCLRWCHGDPDCIHCCVCISRGGSPRHCCF